MTAHYSGQGQVAHPEMSLRTMFEDFSKILSNQNKDRSQQIENWRQSQIKIIDEHAKEQLRLLNREFNDQVQEINGIYNQYLTAIKSYKAKNNHNEINQLLQQCRGLKFELLQLAPSSSNTYFANFVTQKQLDEKRRQDNQMNTSDFDSSGINGNNANSSASASSSMHPAINSNDLVFDDNKPIKKCQKCFMIFSRTMSDIDQAKHISEHDNS